MGLKDWGCDNDKFEPAIVGFLSPMFPCSACKHLEQDDTAEPCSSCGHNLSAVIEDIRKQLQNETDGN